MKMENGKVNKKLLNLKEEELKEIPVFDLQNIKM
jgi:hypothetical protein